MYLRKSKTGAGFDFVDHYALVQTFAKCQVHDFAKQTGRFLEASDWEFERELSDLLWIAGDPSAEASLLRKLTKIRAEYARFFFVQGLGIFDAPSYSDFFAQMTMDEDERVKATAVQFLGWSKKPQTLELLIDLLQKTQSSFVAESAARALRQLNATDASVHIMEAIERFESPQRAGLIREAAFLRNTSVINYVKDIALKNDGHTWQDDDLLQAVGEFYDEQWAKKHSRKSAGEHWKQIRYRTTAFGVQSAR